MKRVVLFLLFSLVVPFFVRGQQQSIPEIPFEANASLLQLPADLYLGEVAGVAVNFCPDLAALIGCQLLESAHDI